MSGHGENLLPWKYLSLGNRNGYSAAETLPREILSAHASIEKWLLKTEMRGQTNKKKKNG